VHRPGPSEAGRRDAIRFLERCLIGQGEVALYVNPEVPIEAELARGDPQDWILYGRRRYRELAAARRLRPEPDASDAAR
jgi:hypothetical protein